MFPDVSISCSHKGLADTLQSAGTTSEDSLASSVWQLNLTAEQQSLLLRSGWIPRVLHASDGVPSCVSTHACSCNLGSQSVLVPWEAQKKTPKIYD